MGVQNCNEVIYFSLTAHILFIWADNSSEAKYILTGLEKLTTIAHAVIPKVFAMLERLATASCSPVYEEHNIEQGGDRRILPHTAGGQ